MGFYKKILLVLVLIVPCVTMAQQANYGIRVGVSESFYRGSDFQDTSTFYSNNIQPTAGLYVNYSVTDLFWIKSEFNFMNRSFDRKDGLGNSLRENYYYIDIHPVTPTIKYKGFQVFAGPAVSLLLTSKKDSVNTNDNTIVTYSDANLYAKNRYDLGFVCGVEYEYKNLVNIGVRYTHGFTSIFQTPQNADRNIHWYNHSFLFTVGYSFIHVKN